MRQHLVELGHVDARLDRQRGGLRRGRHLRRVDQVVAELDHLAHARAPDVHDQAGKGLEGRLGLGQHDGVAAHHERERSLLRPRRAARQGCVEVARAGGGHPRVLSPFHLGVDGRTVDHGPVGSERGQHGVDHLDHLGRVGDAQDHDLGGLRHGAGRTAIRGALRHRGVDRAPAARGDGHVVARRHQVARHGQAHGAQPNESDAHACPSRRVGRRYTNWGSHSAVPASSSSTMASWTCRSPRPANGSRAKASAARARSPCNAASTVSSCVAT